MSKYILGGGVAGMLTAFYNEEYKIISTNVMGQLNSPFILGPRVFKTDKYTENFLKKLNLNFHVEKKAIGFINKSPDVLVNLDDNFKEKYSRLTRNTDKVEKSFLSSGATEIEYFTDGSDDFYVKVFKKLYTIIEDRIIKGVVTDIHTDTKELKYIPGDSNEKTAVSYNKIISTLNIKVLCKILGITEIKPKATKKHFICTEYTQERDLKYKEKFAYMYSTNGTYSRKTFFDNYIVYENLIPLNFIKEFEGSKIIKVINNVPVQIVNSIDIQSIKDIELIGRFAQWNHKIKATEIIKKYEQ